MKPKRKNRTYNPVLLLFYTIMRMIFFPIYLTGKIIEILSTLIVPASATLYLIFLVYDVYTIIRDGFVFPSDIILPVGVGILILFGCAVICFLSEFLKAALAIPAKAYEMFDEKCKFQKCYKRAVNVI